MELWGFPLPMVKVTDVSPLPSPELDALQLVLPDIVPGVEVTPFYYYMLYYPI